MSLRTRLLAGMAIVSLVLVVTSLVVVRTTENHLVDQIDRQLASVPMRNFAASGGLPTPPPDDAQPRVGNLPTPLYGARLDGGEFTVLFAPSVSAAGLGRPQLSVRTVTQAARDGRPITVSSTTGSDHFRVRAERFSDGSIGIVGLALRDVDATVKQLRLVLVVAAVMVIAILGLVVFWVLVLGVRPIKRMTKTASDIAAGDLGQRVPRGRPGTEASELGDALNVMLGTIEGAFAERAASEARLRRFVADASHELRTPVTTIRGYAELYRHGGLGATDDIDLAMYRTEQESIRMTSLIDDLLLLARLDEGRPLERAPVDLGVLAVDAAADARAVAPDRTVKADIAEGVTVEGDEDRLRQVIGNLVGNSLAHTRLGSSVLVCVRNGDGRAVLEVRDEGPGMTPDVAARAFERFSRGDQSRSRDAGGSGLGLAIVQAIVEAHGGEVRIVSSPNAGTTVTVELWCDTSTGASAMGSG